MALADLAGPVFGALSDPTRRRVLAALAERRTATATQLASELPVSRQAVLKHLSALSAAELVTSQRSGREVHYRLTPAPLSEAMSWMAAVGAQWDQRLALLERHLAGADDEPH